MQVNVGLSRQVPQYQQPLAEHGGVSHQTVLLFHQESCQNAPSALVRPSLQCVPMSVTLQHKLASIAKIVG